MEQPPAPARRARCWTLVGAEAVVDVELDAADDAPLSVVLAALTDALGAPVPALWAGSDRLPAGTSLASPALAHGCVLGLGRPGPRSRAARTSALELQVTGGPDAGRWLPLDRGRHVLGRGTGADVALTDVAVSREHAVVEVGAAGTTVADLGSRNGTALGGRPVGDGPLAWAPGTELQLGSTTVRLTGPQGSPATSSTVPGGRVLLTPAPAAAPHRPAVEVRLPAPPTAAAPRRLAWAAVALPAVAGCLVAWLLHTPSFLAMALLSPLVALGTWLSDRVTGRRAGRHERERHRAELEQAEQRVATAVAADLAAAEAARPDLAVLSAAARRRTTPLWTRTAAPRQPVTVRIGRGPAESRVVRVAADGSRAPALLDRAPLDLDLARTGGLGVAGPRAVTTDVLAGVVAQLVTTHPPGELTLAVVTTPERLPDWSWVRWLPHVRPGSVQLLPADPALRSHDRAGDAALAAWVTAQADGAGAAGVPRPAVLVDAPVGPRTSAALLTARDEGLLVLTRDDRGAPPVDVGAVLRVTGETGDVGELVERGAPPRAGVLLDRFGAGPAAELARALAPLQGPAPADAVPSAVRLAELLPATGWDRSRQRLLARLGRTRDGTATVDLCAAGPHALVAGTTGSGKSELLQTLVAGLAAAHPPDRCSFLLVDYKGGAAFAAAADLPHTVGLLTDLDARSTGRALRSLGAELTRRERLLADCGVRDVADLPDGADLARLVIVVDEFATLAEELPDFVPGLVGIAQRGRSLGLHLVLATQRPAGVVSPEIRANCSLRICLRTTDEGDSRDVLGSPAAARLPASVPGRALLRAGGSEPVLLQVARVSTAVTEDAVEEIRVRRWSWAGGHPSEQPSPGARPEAGDRADTDLDRLVADLRDRAAVLGVRPPHRPWSAPLPVRLTAEDLDREAAVPVPAGRTGRPCGRLLVGLADRPDEQRREGLVVDLDIGGGWLGVGGPRSGRSTLLRTVLAAAVHQLPPDRLHVHVLDHGGGTLARAVSPLAHTGTAVGATDALRTVRLLTRLSAEVAARRAAGTVEDRPRLLLLVDGVEALCAQLDEADPAGGSAVLLRLVRDGAAAGLTCLLTADRAVPGGRLAASVVHRLVLPLPDRADYAVAGVPLRAVPDSRVPGRALLDEDGTECQLALPRPLPDGAAWVASPGVEAPLRVVELPPDPRLPAPRPGGHAGPDGPRPVVAVGPGGDEGTPLTVDLARSGGLLVAGPPGSGRSSALRALAGRLRARGTAVVLLGRGRDADLTPDDVGGLRAWLDGQVTGPVVVAVDDAPVDGPLADLLAGRAAGSVAVLAAGTPGELAAVYRGPVAALRRDRAALLLQPAPGDAELLGLRLPRTPVAPRPGSGWLVLGPEVHRVQVARAPDGAPC